jgi:hypothetical protein
MSHYSQSQPFEHTNFNSFNNHSPSPEVGQKNTHEFIFSSLKEEEQQKFFEIMVNNPCDFSYNPSDGSYTATLRPQSGTFSNKINASIPQTARVQQTNKFEQSMFEQR